MSNLDTFTLWMIGEKSVAVPQTFVGQSPGKVFGHPALGPEIVNAAAMPQGWRKRKRMKEDEKGHEHAPAGSPTGGEFVPKGGGGAPSGPGLNPLQHFRSMKQESYEKLLEAIEKGKRAVETIASSHEH